MAKLPELEVDRRQGSRTRQSEPFDLVITCDRVFCADTGLDGPGKVAVRGDRIVASGPEVSGEARETLDYSGALLLPGLVDLHAHPDRDSSRYGVDPDVHFLTRGVTTVMSQGDAGSRNWSRYRDEVILGSKTRVRLAINLSAPGETNPTRCYESPEDIDVEACVQAVADGGDLVWGISVNTSEASCGEFDPREVMSHGVEAAERTGRPLLFGSRLAEDVPLEEQLDTLRPGDVLTYCFNAKPQGLIENGRVRDCVRGARERGILFDIGHGMASFSFETAEVAIADGFLPDTISTDQYARHVGSDPQHDLPRTMSKLMAAGISETDAFERVTLEPARILGMADEIGTLAPGSCADITVLRWNDGATALKDVEGVERASGCWEPVVAVRAGEVVSSSD